ncbi:hypothetical protein, partial [Shewanella colwelliana]|uniref:hypothetical protein n=1 Tax=Shewanella colwelliana TaxID=23 RepID=UPI003734FD0D
REPDLNRRPSGYEPDELPYCSIPRPLFKALMFSLVAHGATAEESSLLQSGANYIDKDARMQAGITYCRLSVH